MPLKFDGKTGEFGACVSHFKGKGKSDLSARKICGAIQKRMEKEHEHKFCTYAKLQLKEAKEDFHVSGYVATSHPDRAVSEDGQYVGDIIPKSSLQRIANDINNRYKPQAGAVSERHDHLKGDPNAPIAGVLARDTLATLQQLDDGEWGVHVDTVLSKTNPGYEDVKTNIEQGLYPGFSIEYTTNEFVPTEKEGKMYRMLTDIDTEGFGYANRRKIANPHAEYTDYGYKEIGKVINMKEDVELKALHDIQEDKKKADAAKKKKNKKKGDDTMKKEEIKEDTPAEGAEENKDAQPEAPKEEPKAEPATEEKELKVSSAEFSLLAKFREQQVMEAKMKELEPVIAAKLQAEMKERGFREAPVLSNDDDGKPEFKEFNTYVTPIGETRMKEFDDVLAKRPIKASTPSQEAVYTQTIDQQWKEAGALANSFVDKGIPVYQNYRNKEPAGYPADLVAFPRRNLGEGSAFKEINGRIEAKEFFRLQNVEMKAGGGLGVTNATNANLNLADSWTYGSYFLSPVELNDIFQPVLINQLNDQTTTYGSLTKEDWSGRSQIQFRARIGRNST
ncbi:hypothetical protein LCGC14_2231150, partial [marine sediment metagenome]